MFSRRARALPGPVGIKADDIDHRDGPMAGDGSTDLIGEVTVRGGWSQIKDVYSEASDLFEVLSWEVVRERLLDPEFSGAEHRLLTDRMESHDCR